MRKAVVALIAVALVALTMAYRVLAMGGPLGGFENDQFVTLSQAQQMAMGDWPVRDFVSLGKPLTILVSAVGQLTMGPTLFSEAVLTTAIIGVCTAIMFLLAWRASGSIAIAVAVALVQIAMAPRFYNFPKLLAYALAIPALWAYIDRPDRRRLFLVAVAGIVAFLLRHDHGVYVGATAILTVALVWRTDRRRLVREVTVLGLMALALVAPYLVYVQLHYGLVVYFDSFVRYANRTAERTSGEELKVSFDSSQPFVLHVPSPRPQAHIHVRWRGGTTAEQRADREQALGLTDRQVLDGDVVNYVVSDTSTPHLRAIVQDPLVADTDGIDRRTFVINDPSYTHVPTAWERAVASVRDLRVLPGLLHRANAVTFLYYVMYAAPVIACVLLFTSWKPGATAWANSTLKIVVVAVMTLVIDRAFLRGNITSRLADVTEPVGVLVAWIAATVIARSSRAARVCAACVLLLVFVLTCLSVEAIENVSGQIGAAGVTSGNMGEHAREVHTLLSATPAVDAWPDDAEGMEALAKYVRQCTAPEDRVLALGYIPELFFMSYRRFAAGQVWILPGFFNTEPHESFMVDRIVRYRVPIAVTVPDPEYSTDYVPSFPAITRLLSSQYRDVGTIDFGRGFRFRILVRSELTPTRMYRDLPCFS